MNPQNSAQALAQLQDYQKTAQDPNTILANQQQQLGVNAARDTVTGLRGAINNTTKLLQQVAPSVMGRTGGSLVTNAQAGRIIQNESAPIAQNLSTQGTQYNQAAEDLNNLQQQAREAASGIYQGQQDKLSYAQNLYNALYKQEQDAADRAFQEQQAAAARAAAAGGSYNLGGGSTGAAKSTGATLTGGKTKADAANAVNALLKTNNGSTITNTVNAILKSASYGNTYDQAKVELLKSLGLVDKNNKLVTAKINPNVAGLNLSGGGLLGTVQGLTY